jgi:hypothetical protein
MDHNIEKLIRKPVLEGQGSSSGITGMQVKKYPCEYKAGPITQRAKQ